MRDLIKQLDEELNYYKEESSYFKSTNIRLMNEKVKFEHLLLISMIGNIVLALIAFA